MSIRSMLKLLEPMTEPPSDDVEDPAKETIGADIRPPHAVRVARAAVEQARSERDVAMARLTISIAEHHAGARGEAGVYAAQAIVTRAETEYSKCRGLLAEANASWMPRAVAALEPHRAAALADMLTAARLIVAACAKLHVLNQVLVRQGLEPPALRRAYAILSLRRLAEELLADG